MLAATLPALAACGFLRRRPDGCYAVTPRGFDRFHDLERWVTYHMIEPLWAQMLAEHDREGSTVGWATPGAARHSHLWSVLSRLMERGPGS